MEFALDKIETDKKASDSTLTRCEALAEEATAAIKQAIAIKTCNNIYST